MDIKIGDLRYEVTIARRRHLTSLDLNVAELGESYTQRQIVWANIVPTGTVVFLNSIQTEISAITHKIYLRWMDGLDRFSVIMRECLMPDGSTRTEIYRIHRVGEWQGRQRFLVVDAELEQQETD